MAVQPDDCTGVIRDAGQCTNETDTVKADYCIIGCGTTGITIARELVRNTQKSVVILEGSLVDTPRPVTDMQHHRYEDMVAQGLLYRGYAASDSQAEADEFFNRSRIRVLGGTSNCWEGWTRPLEDHDFGRKSLPSFMYWPANAKSDLLEKDFYQRAMDYCSVGHWHYANYKNTQDEYDTWAREARDHGDGNIEALEITEARLQTAFILQMGHQKDGTKDGAWAFQKRWLPEFKDPKRSTIYRNAHVQKLIFRDGKVDSLQVKTLRYSDDRKSAVVGHTFKVVATKYVLAASCIENARLLILSGYAASQALGKYLITHPLSTEAATFTSTGTVPPKANRLYGGLTKINLTDYPPTIFAVLTPTMPWLDSGAWGDFRAKVDFTAGTVNLNWELLPNSLNQIYLNPTEADIFQNRLGVVDLRIYEKEPNTTQAKALAEVETLVTKKGYGTDFKRTGNKPILTGEHAMGATRMGFTSETGVVDENCRVFGNGNLFVAGGSVIPAGGWANPTLTILALAIRLADHIAKP